METRIIKAVFGASKSIVAPKRFKNDWGQVLELVGITLPQTFTAHFSNSKTGMAKKRIGQNNQVDVPDEFFTSGADIFCWVMVHDTVSDGRTMYTVRIPIEDRADVTDVEPTPVEQDVITQAIAALNSAVEKTAQDVESADASAQSAKADADRAETARDTAEGYVVDVQNYAQQAQASANSAASSATSSASSASQAQQMKTDVQGLVSDAQSAASASAQSATVSAQSAYQASASATSASQSAETASTKASEASASAQTASAKATEANGYASTASQKASESSQSASSASGYATQAGQAKTAAETAQGLAEQAQSDAESAKDDAETARDEAQQAVASISGALDDKAPIITDTASGAIASFTDGADDLPLKSLVIDINPVQDLHGQNAPYPAGGGKNLLDINSIVVGNTTNWSVEVDGDTLSVTHKTEYSTGTPSFAFTQPSGTYVISIGSINLTGQVSLYVNGSWAKTINNGNTFTIDSANTNEIKFSALAEQTTVIKKIQIEKGTTPTAYAPYENLCPISGWNGVNVSHSGADTSDATVYPITFPTEAGTVYGGTLNVVTGELVVDKNVVQIPADYWFHNTKVGFFWTRADGNPFIPNIAPPIVGGYDVICSAYKHFNGTQYADIVNGEFSVGLYNYSSRVSHIIVRDTRFTTIEDFRANSGIENVSIEFPFATPQTYQLAPTEIRSLLGQNSLFADTGNTEVEYRADTKLYIQKKITEAVNALA